jgi:hypothetical protein
MRLAGGLMIRGGDGTSDSFITSLANCRRLRQSLRRGIRLLNVPVEQAVSVFHFWLDAQPALDRGFRAQLRRTIERGGLKPGK